TGDGQVADGAVAHPFHRRGFTVDRLGVLGDGEQYAVALEHLALVREVNRRQLKIFQLDVAPDVELGPVAQREDPDLFTLLDPAVVQRPRLRTLRAWVPLAELVAEAQNALLCAGALLVSARPAECRIESARVQRVEQCARLLAVAGRA